jgi:hypothetical protein
MGRPAFPVDDLMRFLEERQVAGPPVDTPASDFEEATFTAIFKGASLRTTGAWRVIIEVPSAEADAFYPVRKAFELEVTCTVTRKARKARRQKADPPQATGKTTRTRRTRAV